MSIKQHEMDFTLELEQVSFQYTGIGGSSHPVLQDINLKFENKECTAVIGPSGSGKTTLIQHFTGLLQPTAGTVRFDGRDIWKKPHRFADIRKKVGLVFQFPESQLFEETVYKDIAFGPLKFGCSKEEIDKRVRSAMDDVGLAFDTFSCRIPFKLSEGEKRRVAIAGILAMEPRMVVMDEPTAGLDPRGVRKIITIIDKLLDKGVSIVLITHNMELVARVANRILVMNHGKIIGIHTPKSLFDDQETIIKSHLEIPGVITLLKSLKNPVLVKLDENDPLRTLQTDIERINKVIQ